MRTVFICDGVRTPFGRFGGGLAKVRPDDLAAVVIRGIVARNAGLDGAVFDEVVLGCANQAGEDNRNVARMALLLAGLSDSVPGVTVNRLCASGLEAIAYGSRAIIAGQADLVIAGGVESMTRAPFVIGKADNAWSRMAKIEDTTIGWRFVNPAMQKAYGIDSMPETAENVAREFNINRADQDAFALRSQQRAQAAQARGFFNDELVPVHITDRKGSITIAQDEHPRFNTSLGELVKLTPIIPGGVITAGNAAGINDGAAAVLLASEEAVKRYGLTPRARIVGYATVGVSPRIMGIGPVLATQRLLAQTGLKFDQFDTVELNEAFAAQVLAVLRQLGIDDNTPSVNPNGGAISIGHPLGASGARLALTAMRALEETGGRRALVTLCVGVGQGVAMAIER
jgi:3-oxoadipyl-CoA thiolase